MTTCCRAALAIAFLSCLSPGRALAQIDQQRAAEYFEEAAMLCEREGGRLWGVSLCGPMVFADPATRTLATNQPAPSEPWPSTLGIVNAPIPWGGGQWSAYVWAGVAAGDSMARRRRMLHELFHRVQPQLGLMVGGKLNDHLDTADGRYWLQLEWRALGRALASTGSERNAAIADALGFRNARRGLFPGAAEAERALEIREGLAQYTGTVAGASSTAEAEKDAIRQLSEYEAAPTFVGTFAYPSGAAYGLLLDQWAPGWTRRMKGTEDLGQLVMDSAKVQPVADTSSATRRYRGQELRVAEDKRQADRRARLAELRRRFVDGPVLITPRAGSGMIDTSGMTPIGDAGTVIFTLTLSARWGTLDVKNGALESADRQTLRLTAPSKMDGSSLAGDGWTITLAPGWVVRPGSRSGDLEVVRAEP